MFELPLHPKMIHLPLGLAAVLPLVLGGLLIAIRGAWLPERAWWMGAGLAWLLLGGVWAGVATGEAEEERVEAFVAERSLEAHEESAEGFLALTALTALAVLAGALVPVRLRTALRVLSVVGALGALGLAVRTGLLGGELVYRHGAARAWMAPAPAEPKAEPPLHAHGEGD